MTSECDIVLSCLETPAWTLFSPTLDYLEGHGDLVGRFIMGIIGVILWVIGVINLLTKFP